MKSSRYGVFRSVSNICKKVKIFITQLTHTHVYMYTAMTLWLLLRLLVKNCPNYCYSQITRNIQVYIAPRPFCNNKTYNSIIFCYHFFLNWKQDTGYNKKKAK